MEENQSLPFNPNSDAEVAEWFAQHDATDLSLEAVEGVHVKTRRHKDLESLTIRIASEDMDQLKHLAEEYGVGHTTIARMLLHRELKDPRPLANH
jgi:predicted DNA binding CopG/RHH family protein